MRIFQQILILIFLITLSGCTDSSNLIGDIDRPAEAGDLVGRGTEFDGNVLISPEEIKLTASNTMYQNMGKYTLSCTGTHYGKKTHETMLINLYCSYGITGIASINFDTYGKVSGSGTFKLSDGSSGNVWFGEAILHNRATGNADIAH
jgi:hypothetical protein